MTDNKKKFINFLEENGYTNIVCAEFEGKVIWAALYRLMFTTAIVYGLDDYGYSRRYCFEDPTVARGELADWAKLNLNPSHEPSGFVAKRI